MCVAVVTARSLGKFEVCLTSKKVAVSLSLNSYCVTGRVCV